MTNAAGAGIWRDLAGTESRVGIVDGGVTQRALNAYRLQRSGRVEKSGKPDDRVQLQQYERDRRVIEIDLAFLDLLLNWRLHKCRLQSPCSQVLFCQR
jgi:hypothetical protein